ncbi:MAG: SDR family NAD(P)-dependent oxidoreductase, partial [Verrucomicrobia bacterium]|nr:SDR family NAD(P)-dependent oxidoreductase [Verrucomicrobiota bacterium]
NEKGRWCRALEAAKRLPEPWGGFKAQGVYLITGGTGGVGSVIARYLAERYQARIILMSRSARVQPSAEDDRIILEAGDVTNRDDTARVVEAAVSRFGRLDGVLHLAGIKQDRLLAGKTPDVFVSVLRPKTLGAVNLDQATASLPLDFFILFSSVAGELGNTGQTDYACANAFLDRFAEWREQQRRAGARSGRTVSIDWPLWQSGGMTVDPATEEWMRATLGISPLSSAAGCAFLEAVFSLDAPQLFLWPSAVAPRALPGPGTRAEGQLSTSRPVASDDDLRERTLELLRGAISKAMKLPLERLGEKTGFDTYGLDSVSMVALIRQFETDFGVLPKTLFFETHNLAELADYFLAQHGAVLRQKFPPPARTSSSAVPDLKDSRAEEPTQARGDSGIADPVDAADIAIIGVSGRYPDARNLAEFWENLKAGRDSIREIPPDRWNHSAYFDPNPSTPGKTYSKWGGFIDGVDEFDPLFFNISPREAVWIDPQERLFLETAWSVVEDAGYSVETLRSKFDSQVGVFAGVMWGEYQLYSRELPGDQGLMVVTSSYASIANRVSYVLGLQGPSLALDTMCSSSLTAVHLACESLRRGECRLAIAGGVNVSVHPHKYVQLAQGRFAASDGRCRSFGAGGDGYVPGEGVGAVLLKPLAAALADGDSIRAVIKGSSINHGGRTTGYTVPNPKAQAALIRRALQIGGVDPRTINYVEAHGTGTALGDPVEIRGLVEGFQADAAQGQICAIGSVKSNIGHLESAAGIAALTKVLLQFRHQQIVPSLHADPANPNIDFTQTPFFVPRRLMPWPPAAGASARRRACVSSFGAGGSNAHVVLEEAPEQPAPRPVARPFWLAVISAKTQETLRVRISDLVQWLEAEGQSAELMDVCYGLSAGRSHFERRCAVLISTKEELLAGLKSLLAGEPLTNVLMADAGNLKPEDEAVYRRVWKGIADDLTRADHSKPEVCREVLWSLAGLYVKGFEFDWSTVYAGLWPRRVALPTYPFKRERYWVPAPKPAHGSAGPGAALHPLIDRVEPRRSFALPSGGMVFGKEFQAQDPIVRDHRVMGYPVLPGVALLEMIRAAVAQVRLDPVVRIQHLTWMRPVVVHDQRQAVNLILHEAKQGLEVRLEIEGRPEPLTHAVGTVVPEAAGSDQRLDLEAIRQRCPEVLETGVDTGSGSTGGSSYGPYFRAPVRIWRGAEEALAQLELPTAVEAELLKMPFHPVLLDGAMRALVVLQPPATEALLLYSIEEAWLAHGLTATSFAYLRKTGPLRFDLVLCRADGTVGATLKEVTFRPVPNSASAVPASTRDPLAGLVFLPRWVPTVLTPAEHETAPQTLLVFHAVSDRDVVANWRKQIHAARTIDVTLGARQEAEGEDTWEIDAGDPASYGHLFDRLQDSLTGALDVIFLGRRTPREHFDKVEHDKLDNGVALFRLLRELARRFPDREVRLKVITEEAYAIATDDPGDAHQAGLWALAGVAGREHPKWSVCCVDGPATHGSDEERAVVDFVTTVTRGEFAWRAGRAYDRALFPVALPSGAGLQPLRRQGVYLIVGGAGAVGFDVSQSLAESVGARLAWIGRSPVDASRLAKIERIKALGGEAIYVQADATSLESSREAIDKTVAHFGELHGVIHSALVFEGEPLATMPDAMFQNVIAPKINGAIALGEVCAGRELDFLVYFSSIQTYTRDKRQAAYACGSAFLDAYGVELAGRVPFPVRVINWGYWDSAFAGREAMKQQLNALGFGTVPAREGFEALQRTLCGPVPQVAVFKAEPDVRTALGVRTEPSLICRATEYPSCIRETLGSIQIPWSPAQGTVAEDPAARRRLTDHLVLRAFQEMGLFMRAGERHRAAALREDAGVLPKYERLFGVLLGILERAGFIVRVQDNWEAMARVDDAACRREVQRLDETVRTLAAANPLAAGELALVQACFRTYPRCLRGQVSATEVMFPAASTEKVEGVYTGNEMVDFLNRHVAACVVAFAKRRAAAGQAVRILEVGAGTGSTTAVVLEAMDAAGISAGYVFTDISKAFTLLGQRRFSAVHPALEFDLLDVERPVAEQGFAEGSFDVVIAANVLHATRRMDRTLVNVKALLRPNGWLILNEATSVHDLTTLTFGLLDGWWLFEDSEARLPESPLLSLDGWRRTLSRAGFRYPGIPGVLADTKAGWPQHVIVAESDGVVEARKRELTPENARRSQPTPAATTHQTHVETSAGAEGQLAERVRKCVAESLAMKPDDIDPESAFSEYGVDSIIGVDVIQKLNAGLEIELRTTALFDYPNVSSLAGFIARSFPNAVSPASGRAAVEPVALLVSASRSGREGGAQPEQAEFPETAPATAAVPRGVAVIGMAGRFPGAGDVGTFWRNLAAGRSAITEAPPGRWSAAAFYDAKPGTPGKTNCKWGGFIDDIDAFDSLFFRISPAEAERMDPQQRLFLEECWHAIEDAGYAPSSLSGARCGVFVGAAEGDYASKGMSAGAGEGAVAMASNDSSIMAARIAYLLNLKGPTLSLNAACASSLVAIHLACQSILNGENDFMLAGGAFLRCTPGFHIAASEAGMLSPDGRCYAFDQRANGFLPGETVGVVLLKSLEAAQRDGDHIYGVILGSAVNQDGKTNGITAPSTHSQIAVETEVYERFGIQPETLSYVETHGTGTKLGDPIEIEALTTAFRKFTPRERFCPIGSVKTNIGHAALASGVASVIKVLQALRHGQLPPSLNFETPNEHIDFEHSPFYVNTTLQRWDPPTGQPRRAAVSSFGFSGTNCHLVLEQAPVHREVESRLAPVHPVPLSAKTAEGLRLQIQNLAQWLQDYGQEIRLADVSFTLCCGRDHFAHRLVILVTDLDDLRVKVAKLRDGASVADVFQNLDGSKSAPVGPERRRQLSESVSSLRFEAETPASEYRAHLEILARAHADGAAIEWSALFAPGQAHRISLPGYPFRRSRHWISSPNPLLAAVGFEAMGPGHPLLHENRSVLGRVEYRAFLSRDAYYLRDHVVGGQVLLPGAASIEMARAAGACAVPGQSVKAISRVTWASPIPVEAQPVTARVELIQDGPNLRFELATGEDGEHRLRAQGWLELGEAAVTGQRLALSDIEKALPTIWRKDEIYHRFEAVGVAFGPSFLVLDWLKTGAGRALGLLRLPAALMEQSDPYVLHPCLLDGAFQTTVGLGLQAGVAERALPFAVDRVEIFRALPPVCYALAREVGGDSVESLKQYDIDIWTESGELACRIKGFKVRTAGPGPKPAESQEIQFLQPVWEPEASGVLSAGARTVHALLVLDFGPERVELLRAEFARLRPGSALPKIVWAVPGNSGPTRGSDGYEVNPPEEGSFDPLVTALGVQPGDTVHVLNLLPVGWDGSDVAVLARDSVLTEMACCRQFLRRGITSLAVLSVCREDLGMWVAGWGKCLVQEHPKSAYTLAQVSALPERALAARLVGELERVEGVHELRLNEDGQVRKRLAVVEGLAVAPELWRPGGVYLISGGLGGLGRIFAEDLASRFNARLVLCGRSALTDADRDFLRHLDGLGGKAIHVQADVSVREETRRAVGAALSTFGSLQGVLHAAGVAHDERLVNKPWEEAERVLAPKLLGTVNLDQATLELDLDGFALFSSVSAETGNAGQADYAAGNAFLDCFAAWRTRLWQSGKRRGRTVSINWPLWEAGGMRMNAATQAWLKTTFGMRPLTTEEGLAAFRKAVSVGVPQVMVVCGTKVEPRAVPPAAVVVSAASARPPGSGPVGANAGLEKLRGELAAEISSQLKVAIDEIDPDEDLHEYGFDSVSLTVFSNRLNQRYQIDTTPALFFEYPTLAKVSTYLVETYPKQFAGEAAVSGEPAAAFATPPKPATPGEPNQSAAVAVAAAHAGPREREPIAVIGMSGRFPGAANLEEFWANLVAARDCVGQPPPERGDWSAFYDLAGQIRWGGFMPDLDKFDAGFFGISPREAELMDPQQRIFLPAVWEAIENAGYDPHELSRRKTGLFAGVSAVEYVMLLGRQTDMEAHTPTGLAHSILANRVSYLLDFTGPSEALDTACSSSLVALHRAVRSLREGECEFAIAGGVNALVSPLATLGFARAGMLSPDGRCKTFDAA